MIGLTETSAVLSSLKAAFDIMRGLSALNDEAEVNAAVLQVQRMLLEAQSEAFKDRETISALANRIRELEAEIAKAGAQQAERDRYALTASSLGAYTYDLKPEFHGQETPHRLCVNCFDQGSKSVLHTKAKHSGGELVHCPRCNTDTILSPFTDTIQSIGRDRSRFEGF